MVLAIMCSFVPVVTLADTTFNSSSDIENLAIANGGTYDLTLDGSPYIFPNGVFITQNVTINVEPGVEIMMGNNRSIQLFNGIFNAIGTSDQPILITSVSGFMASVQFSSFTTTASTANLEYVKISNARYCTTAGRVNLNYKNVTLENCAIAPISTGNLGVNAVFDNITYNKVASPVNGSFLYIGLPDGITESSPVNIVFKNSEYNVDNGLFAIVNDQTASGLPSENINIKINDNVFTGQVKDAGLFRIIDSNTNITLPFQIDATNNYWGDPAGPYYSGTLPKTNGPQVPSNIDFVPFKTSAVPVEPLPECCSNVLFIPGMQGSRLYNLRDNNSEDQLWEANLPSDLVDLYMDANGNILDDGIYTRDVLDRTNIVPDIIEDITNQVDKDIYKNSLEYLYNLKQTNSISNYAVYPYDWRIDVDTIINNGTKLGDGSYSKLVEVLRQEAVNSPTGKVSIMAHSMGGLLAKRFVQTLSEADQDLIDKVIFIAVPHVGTTEGISAVLSGIIFEKPYGDFITKKYTRALAENMPTAHSLVPSAEFFNDSAINPVVFNAGAVELVPELAIYGGSINTADELYSFITGSDGRIDADFNDLGYPNVSPAVVVNKAKALHDEIDSYILPVSIETYQVLGTGRATPKAIVYDKYNSGNGDYISYEIGKTNLGDGTVVSSSAGYLELGDTYYVDLYNYNKDTGGNFDHKNISGIDPVNNLLTSILTETTFTPDSYVSTSMTPNINRHLQISMHSPVDIHLYDNAGRHTGPVYVEINGEVVRLIEENIPNSEYNEYGEAKYIDVPDDGTYNLNLDGYDTGTFTLHLIRTDETGEVMKDSFMDLPAGTEMASSIVINPNLPVAEINLDTDNDGVVDINAKNDGTVIDLNKEEEENCKKEKDKKDKKHKDRNKDDEKECKKDKKDKPNKKPKDKKPKHWHDKHNHEYDRGENKKNDRDYKNYKNNR